MNPYSIALLASAIAYGACTPVASRLPETTSSEDAAGERAEEALILEVVTPDGTPCPLAEVYVGDRSDSGTRWTVDFADRQGLLWLHLRWRLERPERVAAWHPAHGLSRIAAVPIGSRMQLVLDRPMQIAEGRCVTRGGLDPGRIAIQVSGGELRGTSQRSRIEDAAPEKEFGWKTCGYVPLVWHEGSVTDELEEALIHGFLDRVVVSGEDGRFRCCGMRDAAPALRARVEPRFEKGPEEESFVALHPRAIESSDPVPTWRLPYERARWEVVAPEKTDPDDQGTWAVRDGREGGCVRTYQGERMDLWTRERELHVFYARRPCTYVAEQIDLEPASPELQRFEPVPRERLARVSLRTSAQRMCVDVLYAMEDEEISMRPDGGMLDLRVGEDMWVYPTPSRLYINLDPMDGVPGERHLCWGPRRWLYANVLLDPSPGQHVEVQVPERDGARVRIDLGAMREPERRLRGILIDGESPAWLYLDREGREIDLHFDEMRTGLVHSCQLWEPGPAILRHVDEEWQREVLLVPGMNDLRID